MVKKFFFNVKRNLWLQLFFLDVLYMCTSVQFLMGDAASHASLRLKTNSKSLTHHCQLYSQVGWSALPTSRFLLWYTSASYHSTYVTFLMQKSIEQYSLHSKDFFMLSAPNVWTEMEKKCICVVEYVAEWLKLKKLILLMLLNPKEKCRLGRLPMMSMFDVLA